ncbi:MAG: cytochrome c biogenesis protein CcmE [Alphaproteobacteria bacterium RIFCSPLOWO2_01_FULL_40_26]|nr:MAG: cytochrome c biogenesis protein CcmE [Alphaproteobacteria bacterium RIFCSPHIGHO2_02_FULL_40_34]OFW88426.1 MAG: cytochrome c biogenesis protein CcmE [Alphaproteobacteria bacterium RIFCSPHIGHO2_01_FULL_40_8]OFW94381.1 MAG: cytochrome c biogenesis protein CcmE [Alphaproteobacteria bacterium RIFCSPLOWO2_01_FULL_40_26]OFX09471.1 MAG: cytochrome c biogenesis protein CcmE [Alphaproteobacteria bacterium RIFCSPLOWO2_02_FULL_40_19]OFX10731.1 MAG: cytochrome c biogenesis protein CcmE [Alphaproteob
MPNRHKRRRLVFVGSAFVISVVALIFVIKNFRENIVFFYSPTELKSVKISGRQIRAGGMVKEETIKKIDALNIEFVITDYENDLKIHYTGILPDLFREKQGVVAKGIFNVEKNEFLSRELLVKHDENYMPPEVARSLRR